MKIITVAGMISAGKSSLTELISDRYDSLAKYEEIPPILKEWYESAREEVSGERIPFLTQLTFLNQRMKMLRECMTDERSGFAVLDRSIYEDLLFAMIAHEDGNISDMEMIVYRSLLDTMWAELEMIPKKAPDTTIYIRISFETFIDRLIKRGRDIEIDNFEVNKPYFQKLHARYDDYMFNEYIKQSGSPLLVIDGDRYDFIDSEGDREIVMAMIHEELIRVGVVEVPKAKTPSNFPEWVKGKRVLIKAPWYQEEGLRYGEVVEAFWSHSFTCWQLNVKVEGREKMIALYGSEQYKVIV